MEASALFQLGLQKMELLFPWFKPESIAHVDNTNPPKASPCLVWLQHVQVAFL
jgi:hypothetical protein